MGTGSVWPPRAARDLMTAPCRLVILAQCAKITSRQGAVIRSRAALGGQTLPVPIRYYFARPNWDTPPYRGPLTSTLLDVPSQKSRPISAVAEPSSVPPQSLLSPSSVPPQSLLSP